MPIESNSAVPRRFNTALLPWLIGGGALLFYLATLSRWVTLNSIGLVAQAGGWSWLPDTSRPLLYVVLLPFHALPDRLVPLALNAFNALLAALVLVLLARTIALLPHDRTADQRELEEDDNSLLSGPLAWFPPVLAGVALGLQISFWESATAMTGDMLDLLLLAYVIRNLMEFRLDWQHARLYRGALVYALGMTNNWALVGLAPVFLVAVLWVKGLSFFNLQFLLRLILWSVLGLLLYLLMPLIMNFSELGRVPFGDGLVATLKGQKQALGMIYVFMKENYRIVVFAATSLLPLFFIALKWKSSFGDNSHIGIFITKAVFHFVHGVFLVVCLLVLFSPPWSPRQLVAGNAFLAHYYFSALAIGYCAGYFLIVGRAALAGGRKALHPILRAAGLASVGATLAMLLIVPAGLLYRNLHAVRLTNGKLLAEYATRTAAQLPAGPLFLVSDDPRFLALMRAHLIRTPRAADARYFESYAGTFVDYHVAQKTRQPGWPETFMSLTNHGQIRPLFLIGFLMNQAQERSVCYLQPSFGYYFERFEVTPRGTAFPLSLAPTNSFRDTPLSPETVAANEAFWADFDQSLFPVIKGALPEEEPRYHPALKAWLYKKLHLSDERVLTAELLARFYARASTHWAVQVQKLGQWDAAAKHLQRAVALFPESVSAEMNLEFNTAHREGRAAPAIITKSVEDRFGRYSDWNGVINDCGPFDDPRFTFEQARVFLQGGLFRQAYNQFIRATQLEPDKLTPRLWLADVQVQLNQPAEALDNILAVRREPARFGVDATNAQELIRIEAAARFRLGERDAARRLLDNALAATNVTELLRLAATQLYLQNGLYEEAVRQFDIALARNPADVLSQANRGYACLQLNRIADACESLSRAIELDPKNHVVRMNRAIALFRAGRYDESRSDYLELLAVAPDSFQVHFGLGELDRLKPDPAAALKHYQRYLELAPRGTPEYLEVSNRVVELSAAPR